MNTFVIQRHVIQPSNESSFKQSSRLCWTSDSNNRQCPWVNHCASYLFFFLVYPNVNTCSNTHSDWLCNLLETVVFESTVHNVLWADYHILKNTSDLVRWYYQHICLLAQKASCDHRFILLIILWHQTGSFINSSVYIWLYI